MARRRTRGAWFSRKKAARAYAKNTRVGRATGGDWAYRASGREIWVPERVIKHVKQPSRYCALPLRGRLGFAVIDTKSHRAVGSAFADELSLRTCNDQLGGARKRKRRAR
jgi:hypothetical protein